MGHLLAALLSLHPEDSNFYGDNETFDFGPQHQGPTSTNNEKGTKQMLHTPPPIREEDLLLKVPKHPPKTKSPPKTTSRALRYNTTSVSASGNRR